MANFTPAVKNVSTVGCVDNANLRGLSNSDEPVFQNNIATQLYLDVYKRCSVSSGLHARPNPVTTFTVVDREKDVSFYLGVYRKYVAAYSRQPDAFHAYSRLCDNRPRTRGSSKPPLHPVSAATGFQNKQLRHNRVSSDVYLPQQLPCLSITVMKDFLPPNPTPSTPLLSSFDEVVDGHVSPHSNMHVVSASEASDNRWLHTYIRSPLKVQPSSFVTTPAMLDSEYAEVQLLSDTPLSADTRTHDLNHISPMSVTTPVTTDIDLRRTSICHVANIPSTSNATSVLTRSQTQASSSCPRLKIVKTRVQSDKATKSSTVVLPTISRRKSVSCQRTCNVIAASNTHAETSNSAGNSGHTSTYIDLGDCDQFCQYCGASFWYVERLKGHAHNQRPIYHLCCHSGDIHMQPFRDPPDVIKTLFASKHFMENIRAYNQMFSMTSFGAKIDESINTGRGPYVFKVSGQVYHWIGSLCPTPGAPPRFLQIYIYDTENEVQNRMRYFGGVDDSHLDAEIVQHLIDFLDVHNELVRLFRTARDKYRHLDIPDFKIRLYNAQGRRGYELPSSNVLGAMVFDSEATVNKEFDVIIEKRDGPPQRVNKLHPSYMALQFPLLFLHGESGYHIQLKLKAVRTGAKPKRITMLAYYRYQLHFRLQNYDHIFRAGRLFQQYVVGAFCAIEQNRLDYLRKTQNDIRSDYLSGLYDAISRGEREGYEVGGMIILPMSFTGGPRYMYAHYLDALAICRKLGNPQFFVTFTCNVSWPEIKRFMSQYPTLTPLDRADVVCRIFEQKVKNFIALVKKQRIFGTVTGVLYTIEFQKRGLPHCHTLVWVDSASKIRCPEDVNRYISAELPDPVTDAHAYSIVSQTMMHGPCGAINLKAPCMKNGRCTKKFPKKFNKKTFFDDNGHAHYERRDTNITTTRNQFSLDNSYVVPYNRQLLLAFEAHINVEYCGWSMLIKYLFKYISKGTDRVFARVSRPLGDLSACKASDTIIDEIQSYLEGRFICAHEAYWRIMEFDIHHREPAVQLLAVHLENKQRVTFRNREQLKCVVNQASKKSTTLTEWFNYNQANEDGRHLSYLDFPSEFVWRGDAKSWAPRKNAKSSIGRLAHVHPSSGELFYLRMLLCHQKGCTDFAELQTVNNVICSTYRAACERMGLLGDDKEWEIALDEASASATAYQFRSTFCQLLIHCEVTDPLKLWTKYWDQMSYDIHSRLSETIQIPDYYASPESLRGYILFELEGILNNSGKRLQDFGLPSPPPELLDQLSNRLLMEERNYNREELTKFTNQSVPMLNTEQRTVYDLILDASSNERQELIFVYGHGGTGKTFLWKTLINSLRAEGKIVLAVASSGIASLLLPSGRTAHSRFKLPIELTEESLCKITKNTQLGKLLADTDLIIWDEAPMNDRRCFEALDRTLRDIINKPFCMFGGKSILLGGDFRQTLPVKKGASKMEIISCCISESALWTSFKVFTLQQNMRLARPNISLDQRSLMASFGSWLLDVGNGKIGEPTDEDPENSSWIHVPEEYCIPANEDGLSNLISFIYDQPTLYTPSAVNFQEKAIVCPKNETADVINSKVLQMVPGESVTYVSQDEAIPTDNHTAETEMLYPVEHLNTLKLPGFPAHKLELKVGSPVMLLRNLNTAGGLCNGTRMIVRQLNTKLIEVQIITGTRVGEKVFIHRIPLTYKDNDLPFVFKRRQFPLKLCYAMTINKSQGQSLHKIGVYLPQPIFGHGQLYVALSRATSPHGLKILIETEEDQPPNTTKNIVYKDFLEKLSHTSVGT